MKRLISVVLFSSSLIAQPICVKMASEGCLLDKFPPLAQFNPVDLFDRVEHLVQTCFYDKKLHGVKWAAESRAARAKIDTRTTEPQINRVLNTLLAQLNASHTKYFDSGDQDYWALKSVFSGDIDGAPLFHTGAIFQEIGGHWYVRSVLKGSPSDGLLQRGDEVLEVNGKTLSPVAAFADGKEKTVTIRETKGSSPRNVVLKPVKMSFQRSLLTASQKSEMVFNKGSKRIGYFHLWSGTHDLFRKKLMEAVGRLGINNDAMILDLRDGFGGANEDYLTPFLKNGKRIFPIPVYVLINEGVRSGKETLAYRLKESKEFTLIGKRTAGYYLGGRLFELFPDRSALYLAVCGDSPAGVALEGIGVGPDVEVDSPLPFSQGADPQLVEALKLAYSRL